MRILALCLLAIVAFAQDVVAPGDYKGTYSGGGGGGDFRITIKPDGKGGMSAQVGFTVNGEAVNANTTSLKINATKIEFAYDFDLQGTKLTSAAKGEITGKTLQGTYTTSAERQAVDQGTWKATSGNCSRYFFSTICRPRSRARLKRDSRNASITT